MDLNKGRTAWGYQVWWRDVTMGVEMMMHSALVVAVLQVVVFLGLSWLLLGNDELLLTWGYVKALLWGLLSPHHVVDITIAGQIFQLPAAEAAVTLGKVVRPDLWKVKTAAVVSFATLGLWPVILGYFKRQARNLTEPKYIQGARFADAKEINHNIRRAGGCRIPIGADVRMAINTETEHLFLVGRSGSGKTTIILQMLKALLAQNAKAVVYDFKGDYLSRFYDPERDVVFNPLDTRHVGWSVMRELTTYMDVDAVAGSLIPASQNEDSFWHNAARAVFAGALHTLNLVGEKRNAALWEFLQQDGAQVTAALKSTKQPGWKYIEDASSKQAGSVFATLQQFVHSFEYMAGSDGDFTLTNWLNNPKGGFIFVTNYADIQDTLRPVLSLFVDLMGRRLLSLPDSTDRRVYFLLDELGSLQRLPTLIRLLTLSRSKGGSVAVGIQDVAQLDRIYTRDHRATIVNNSGTKIIMNVKDPATADFCADAIGKTEIEEIEVTNTVRPGEMGDAISFSRRRHTKPLVLPSSIMHELPAYHFYLLLAGQQILKTTTQRMDNLAKIASEFSMRPELRLDHIAQERARLAAEAQSTQMLADQERAAAAKDMQQIDREVQKEIKDRQEQERLKGGVIDLVTELDY